MPKSRLGLDGVGCSEEKSEPSGRTAFVLSLPSRTHDLRSPTSHFFTPPFVSPGAGGGYGGEFFVVFC